MALNQAKNGTKRRVKGRVHEVVIFGSDFFTLKWDRDWEWANLREWNQEWDRVWEQKIFRECVCVIIYLDLDVLPT
jgi:hypothetical protein